MEREISSSAGRLQLVILPLIWSIGVVGLATLQQRRRLLAGSALSLAVYALGLAILAVVIWKRTRTQARRVYLGPDHVRVELFGRSRVIPLERVRYAELYPPGRGARRMGLFIVPDGTAADRALEEVRFIPEGGELLFGGSAALTAVQEALARVRPRPSA